MELASSGDQKKTNNPKHTNKTASMEELLLKRGRGRGTTHILVGKMSLDGEWLGEGRSRVEEALTHMDTGSLGSTAEEGLQLMATLNGVCGCEGDEGARVTAGLRSWLPGNCRRDFQSPETHSHPAYQHKAKNVPPGSSRGKKAG